MQQTPLPPPGGLPTQTAGLAERLLLSFCRRTDHLRRRAFPPETPRPKLLPDPQGPSLPDFPYDRRLLETLAPAFAAARRRHREEGRGKLTEETAQILRERGLEDAAELALRDPWRGLIARATPPPEGRAPLRPNPWQWQEIGKILLAFAQETPEDGAPLEPFLACVRTFLPDIEKHLPEETPTLPRFLLAYAGTFDLESRPGRIRLLGPVADPFPPQIPEDFATDAARVPARTIGRPGIERPRSVRLRLHDDRSHARRQAALRLDLLDLALFNGARRTLAILCRGLHRLAAAAALPVDALADALVPPNPRRWVPDIVLDDPVLWKAALATAGAIAATSAKWDSHGRQESQIKRVLRHFEQHPEKAALPPAGFQDIAAFIRARPDFFEYRKRRQGTDVTISLAFKRSLPDPDALAAAAWAVTEADGFAPIGRVHETLAGIQPDFGQTWLEGGFSGLQNYLEERPDTFETRLNESGAVRLRIVTRPPDPRRPPGAPRNRRGEGLSRQDWLNVAHLLEAIRVAPKPTRANPTLKDVHTVLKKRRPENPRWRTENDFQAFVTRFQQAGFYDVPPPHIHFGRRLNPEIHISRHPGVRIHRFREAVFVCAGRDGFADLEHVMELIRLMDPKAPTTTIEGYLGTEGQTGFDWSREGAVAVPKWPTPGRRGKHK